MPIFFVFVPHACFRFAPCRYNNLKTIKNQGTGSTIKKRVPKHLRGAFKNGHRLGVTEYIDEEFSFELLKRMKAGDKEAEAALEWLTKYNNEYYRGILRKDDPTAIHKTRKAYKEATHDHNVRRRDLIGALKSGRMGEGANTSLFSIEANSEMIKNAMEKSASTDFEDVMIDLISEKTAKRLQMLKKMKP